MKKQVNFLIHFSDFKMCTGFLDFKYSVTPSLAIVFFEMYTQHIPYEDYAIQDLLDAVCIQGARPQIPDECPREFAKLLNECWASDPEQRPTIDSILARLKSSCFDLLINLGC